MSYSIVDSKGWITSAPSLVAASGVARDTARQRPGVQIRVEDDGGKLAATYMLVGKEMQAWVR